MTQGELAAGRGAFAVPGTLDEVVARFEELLGPMERARDARRYFHKLYLRTTLALDSILDQGGFEDPAAMARWGVTFANFYLEALHQADTGQQPSGPWQVAFAAAARNTVPPLRHMLLGMNAHINYDLPLTLLELIDDAEFDDPAVVDRWHRDIEYGNKVRRRALGRRTRSCFARRADAPWSIGCSPRSIDWRPRGSSPSPGARPGPMPVRSAGPAARGPRGTPPASPSSSSAVATGWPSSSLPDPTAASCSRWGPGVSESCSPVPGSSNVVAHHRAEPQHARHRSGIVNRDRSRSRQ